MTSWWNSDIHWKSGSKRGGLIFRGAAPLIWISDQLCRFLTVLANKPEVDPCFTYFRRSEVGFRANFRDMFDVRFCDFMRSTHFLDYLLSRFSGVNKKPCAPHEIVTGRDFSRCCCCWARNAKSNNVPLAGDPHTRYKRAVLQSLRRSAPRTCPRRFPGELQRGREKRKRWYINWVI